MTLQWTFVAGVLYIEIFLVSILLLPFVSPKTWQKLFRSRFTSVFSRYSNIYFNIFIAILVLLFLESIRETWKYSEPMESEDLRRYPEAETVYHMKLFRAQRNMYIAGFALFLWFILRRLVILIASEATLMAQTEASLKQAHSASEAARQYMEEKNLLSDNKKNKDAEDRDEVDSKRQTAHLEKELAQTQTELEKTKEELYRAKLEFTTMKKQAESTNQEYDRLSEEYAKLQNSQDFGQGESDKKK
uniref:Endoplasmic reticulum transmembrane protein n=1 Tax=Arion vulgaris TaxID=1028688 RepID=A0A0B7B8G7_9EUPU